jgi:hypothetical protein
MALVGSERPTSMLAEKVSQRLGIFKRCWQEKDYKNIQEQMQL